MSAWAVFAIGLGAYLAAYVWGVIVGRYAERHRPPREEGER